MKKVILMLAVAVSSVCAFAGEENAKINSDILNAFNSEFVSAKDVTWVTGSGYCKASFVFNDQHVTAFYSMEGDLLGVTRNITSLELPVKLQAKLKKNYSKYWISDLFEVSNNEGTTYYVTLENADQQVILNSVGGTSWESYKSSTKS